MKRILTFLCLLCMANIVSGQTCVNTNTLCVGATFEVCKSNYTQSVAGSDYGLVLMLTAENSATVIQSSGDISGVAQACFTFDTTTLPFGTYQVRALNYDVAAATNAALPVNAGDNVDAVGAVADVCYNQNFLTDIQCYELVPLPTSIAECAPVNEGALINIFPDASNNPADLVYSLDGGAFQSNSQFVVTEVGNYDVMSMNMVTGCSFDLVVSCLQLPLELTSFEGGCTDEHYVLNWTTSSERDIAHFVIERSADGISYTPIGEVAAVGNSTTIQTYAFKDETGGLARYYYRLHIVETTGVEEYSRVVTVACTTGGFGVLDVHPNPTNEVVMITYEVTDRDDITFKITDVLGRTLLEETLTPELGLNIKALDLSSLSPAIYMVLMGDGTQQVAKRVIKE